MAANLMIDVETLGITQHAPMISLGACYFNERGIISTFHIHFDLNESMKLGKKVDMETLKWWLQTNPELLDKELKHQSVYDSLKTFDKFVETVKQKSFSEKINVWAKGPDFDISLLKEYYNDTNLEYPFKYNSGRDVRTVIDLANLNENDFPLHGNHHNPKDDAVRQAEMVIAAWNKIGLQ